MTRPFAEAQDPRKIVLQDRRRPPAEQVVRFPKENAEVLLRPTDDLADCAVLFGGAS